MDRLAVEGGRPVRAALLPYGHQMIDDDDVQAVTETLRSGWLTTGPKVEEFEKAFAAMVGVSHAVAVANDGIPHTWRHNELCYNQNCPHARRTASLIHSPRLNKVT